MYYLFPILTTFLGFLTYYPVRCHLVIDRAGVWGIDDSIALEQPLDASTQNWICGGKAPDSSQVISMVAGQTYSFRTVCGELNLNAPGCLKGDWHQAKVVQITQDAL